MFTPGAKTWCKLHCSLRSIYTYIYVASFQLSITDTALVLYMQMYSSPELLSLELYLHRFTKSYQRLKSWNSWNDSTCTIDITPVWYQWYKNGAISYATMQSCNSRGSFMNPADDLFSNLTYIYAYVSL